MFTLSAPCPCPLTSGQPTAPQSAAVAAPNATVPLPPSTYTFASPAHLPCPHPPTRASTTKHQLAMTTSTPPRNTLAGEAFLNEPRG